VTQNNFRRSGSGGSWPLGRRGLIAHENMEIGRNSSFFAVKPTKTRNGHRGAMTMFP